MTFTTGGVETLAPGNIGIRLVNLNVVDPSHPGADLEVDFDDVVLDASPIPEPASLTLILVSALGILLRRIFDNPERRGGASSTK